MITKEKKVFWTRKILLSIWRIVKAQVFGNKNEIEPDKWTGVKKISESIWVKYKLCEGEEYIQVGTTTIFQPILKKMEAFIGLYQSSSFISISVECYWMFQKQELNDKRYGLGSLLL